MASTAFPSRDDFAAMLNESLGGENETFEGKVVKGERAFYLQAARLIVAKCNEQHDVADAAVAGADALLSA